MPTKQQLQSALINADKAGDAEAARVLANALKSQQDVDKGPEKGSIADALGQGLSFGFSDELAGVLGAIVGTFDDTLEGTTFGERYTGVRDADRENAAAFAERNPGTALAAELGGGLLTGGAGLLRSGGRVAAKEIAKSVPKLAGTGAAVGGVSGAGYSEADDIEGLATDTAVGAGIGAGLGVVAPPLARAVGKAVTAPARYVQASRAARPAKKIQQAIARDDVPLEKVGANLRKLPEGGTLADAGGEGLQTLARDVTVQPGKARNIARSLFEGRRKAAPQRIDAAVRNALGQQNEFHAARRVLQDEMKTAAAPFYKQAYATPMKINAHLKALLGRPSMKQAIKAGANLAREEGEVIGGHVQIFDYAKRALDDKIGVALRAGNNQQARALIGTKNALLKEMDKQVPAYSKARAAFAGPKSLDDALETGRKFMREDAEMIEDLLDTMGASEKEFFRMGAIRQIRDAVLSKSDTADAYKAIFNTPLKREKIRALFPDKKSFAKFERAMRGEARMFETGTAVMANSNTANKLQGVADLARDPGTMADLATSGGVAAGIKALTTWLRQNATGIRSEKMRDSIARKLFNQSKAEQKKLLREIGAPVRIKSLEDIPLLSVEGAVLGGELVPNLQN